MRILAKILVVMMVAMMVGCRDMHRAVPQKNVVAKVGNRVLTIEEIRAATPANLTGSDSLSFVKLYVDHWLIKQLKVEEANSLFSEEMKEIEKLVNDYRQSLMMRRLDQYQIDHNMSEDFTDESIAQYYNSHKANFTLEETLVKGVIVKCNHTTEKLKVLKENIGRVGSSDTAIQTLQDACDKSGYTLINHYAEWISVDEFLSNLPITRSQDRDKILDNVQVQDIVAGDTRYYFYITSVCRKGNIAPIEVVTDKIRRILITQRRAEIIKSHEEEIKSRAFESGHAQIVKPIE